ncbi:MAG: ankyrin repeat domain-containing protein [bacterium]|nr:ankyrin repeat domain-containing protein [bacterium]
MSIFNKKDRATSRLGRKLYNRAPIEQVQAAIRDGADVNGSYSSDWEYNSMLGWAVVSNRDDVVRLLVEHGTAMQTTENSDYQPLIQATHDRRLAAAQALIDMGADLEVKNSASHTPLIHAAHENQRESLQLLIGRGANLDARDRLGNTALHYAATKGFGDVVRMLLEAGAGRDIPNSNMNTAADMAAKEYPRIADMIRGVLPQLEAAPVAPAENETGWKLTDTSEVARVAEKTAIGYRVTEIFNFSAGLYTQIARNLETNAESQSSKTFAQLADSAAVEAARNALLQLGGDAAPVVEKKKLPAPGAA